MHRKNRLLRRRPGYVAVWFSISLVLLMGMVGLVVDGGMYMARQRHSQSAVDAAALAAAMAKLRGRTLADVQAAAVEYATQHNGLTGATVEVYNPPVNGPYATGQNADHYVEVIVTHQISTLFIYILPGVGQNHTVQTRAVAGHEALSIGEGAIVLDPRARPGLTVDGGATLQVDGAVIDNSRGSGLDQFGSWYDTGHQQYSAEVSNNSTLRARYLQTVGGVNDLDNIDPYNPGDPHPLFAGAQIQPDPLAGLPIPDATNGVVLTQHGEVTVDQNDPKPTYLDPGIYDDISITQGADVVFRPGIYVLRPTKPNQGLRINGDVTVTANGVMFYATGSNYLDNGAGYWDAQDGAVELDYSTEQLPPAPDPAVASVRWATVDINANNATMTFTGLQDENSPFDNVLFFQRRRNEETVSLQANAGANVTLGGTIYGKWARFKLAGESRYDAQFVVGSMQVTGQAIVTIAGSGDSLGLALQVFLVE